MVQEIAEKTGLTFLADIWIGGRDREDSASKVIRGMNETLRRLKGKEDDEEGECQTLDDVRDKQEGPTTKAVN